MLDLFCLTQPALLRRRERVAWNRGLWTWKEELINPTGEQTQDSCRFTPSVEGRERIPSLYPKQSGCDKKNLRLGSFTFQNNIQELDDLKRHVQVKWKKIVIQSLFMKGLHSQQNGCLIEMKTLVKCNYCT